MTIATMDALIAALPGRQYGFHKPSLTAEGAGTYHSLWMSAGVPAAGATPTANTIPTKDTLGALPFVNPAGGNAMHLGRAWAAGSVVGSLILYDRLWHTSGLSGTQTTADTAVANTALTRPDANGEGVELWGEIYSAIGATARTLSVRYTNQAGTTNQVGSYAHPANAESVGQMFPISLAAGDTGVRAVTAYHWDASTGAAGNFGFTLLRRIAEIPLDSANVTKLLDTFALGMGRVHADACLAFMVFCSATSTGIIRGGLNLIEG